MRQLEKLLKEKFHRLDAISQDINGFWQIGLETVTRSTESIIISLPNNKSDASLNKKENYDFTIEVTLNSDWKPCFKYAKSASEINDAECIKVFSFEKSEGNNPSIKEIIENQLSNLPEKKEEKEEEKD